MKKKTASIKLRPCPCCGNKDAILDKGTYWIRPHHVRCTACGLRTTGYDTEAEAGAAWNRRYDHAE